LQHYYAAVEATSPLRVAGPQKQQKALCKFRSRNVMNGDKLYFAGWLSGGTRTQQIQSQSLGRTSYCVILIAIVNVAVAFDQNQVMKNCDGIHISTIDIYQHLHRLFHHHLYDAHNHPCGHRS
jgi:hypothetical protein